MYGLWLKYKILRNLPNFFSNLFEIRGNIDKNLEVRIFCYERQQYKIYQKRQL